MATPGTHYLEHEPVMVRQVVELLQPQGGGIYVDATVGGGGHAAALLAAAARGGGQARLVAIDRDPEALARAEERLRSAPGAVRFFRANYSELEALLRRLQITACDGILFDLGVSTWQILSPARGFTYQEPGALLDMRMDPETQATTAADLLNTLPPERLARIFREYGEERWAARIARCVALRRARQPLRRVAELVECVKAAIPAPARRTGGHPARRVFQALRIAVNAELEHLQQALPQAMRLLRPGGRLVVISFHSLEDRIVKTALRTAATTGEPVRLRVLTRRPERPSADEAARNPRSRSARLRAAERVEVVEDMGAQEGA